MKYECHGTPEGGIGQLFRDVIITVGVLEGEVELVVCVEQLKTGFVRGSRTRQISTPAVDVNLHMTSRLRATWFYLDSECTLSLINK